MGLIEIPNEFLVDRLPKLETAYKKCPQCGQIPWRTLRTCGCGFELIKISWWRDTTEGLLAIGDIVRICAIAILNVFLPLAGTLAVLYFFVRFVRWAWYQ